MIFRFRLLLLVSIGLMACDDRVAGKGVASETTNGIVLTGVLEDDSATTRAGRVIELLEPLRDSILSSTQTDSLGRWELRAPGPGRYLIASRRFGRGSVQWVTVGFAERQSVETLVESKLVRLRGRILPGSIDLSGIVASIPALGLRGDVGADSTFAIDGVPVGWHFVQILSASGAILGEGAFNSYIVTSARLDPRERVVLDDFEDDDGGSLLQPVLDGAWWGRWNDTSAIADSARTWGGTTGLSTDSSAYSGRSLHLEMLVGDTIAGRSDLIRSAGLVLKIGGREDLDPESIWFPLSRADSVIFQAKGAGTISFQIRARSTANHSLTGTFQRTLVLTPGWTRIALAASDFQSPQNLDWRSSQFRELAWVSSAPATDLWMDELELSGTRISGLASR